MTIVELDRFVDDGEGIQVEWSPTAQPIQDNSVTPPERFAVSADIEMPPSSAVAGRTTAEASLGLRARAATAAIDFMLAFNPHQRRGPDGRFIKMGTLERKGRRRERDRERRAEQKAAKERAAAPPESDTPDPAEAAYRVARDVYNHQIAEWAVDQQNDNDFDGAPDPDLQTKIDGLREALARGDRPEADRWADEARAWLVDEYEHDDLPVLPRRPTPAPSVQLDEAKLDQDLRDALDDYNAEILATGRAWLDMLRDPEVRADPDSGVDHIDDDFIDDLDLQLGAIRRGILRGEPTWADAAADRVRNMLVGGQLQANHDFPAKPTREEFTRRALDRPVFQRKTSGLLTSGAPITARQAALEQAAAQGIWGDEPIGQGAMGETRKVLFNDGTTAVYKKAKGDWGGSRIGEPWTPTDQTSAEEMASLVGAAIGLRAPAVQRLSNDEIHMELVEDAVPAFNRFYDKDATDSLRVPGEVMRTNDALLMGLFDTLVDNPDRHGFNWMVDDTEHLYPIDHGLSFMNLQGSGQSAAGRSPFAREYFINPDGRYKENVLSGRDIRYIRQQLEPLQAEFNRIGKESWGVAMMQRLGHLETRARGGSLNQLPAPREE